MSNNRFKTLTLAAIGVSLLPAMNVYGKSVGVATVSEQVVCGSTTSSDEEILAQLEENLDVEFGPDMVRFGSSSVL